MGKWLDKINCAKKWLKPLRVKAGYIQSILSMYLVWCRRSTLQIESLRKSCYSASRVKCCYN